MSKIALFGTSADPPTVGHQAIIRWLSAHYDSVAIWASDNPFKHQQTSLKDRTNMLQLMIDDLKISRNNINLYKELSYLRSLITLEKAKEIWGAQVEFSLVIGSDLVNQIPHWYRVEELLEKVQLLIIPRPGYIIEEQNLDRLRILGGRYAIAQLNPLEVSSTEYRRNKNKNAVTQSVANYINRENLYI
ncbi:MAG: nicotinate-nucleotide adenylyltransferase [Moorea sp. SIO2B7]|nr:nicotinate-nucleotide adenylyltransferase [Moorena sp. SIO2B7]